MAPRLRSMGSVAGFRTAVLLALALGCGDGSPVDPEPDSGVEGQGAEPRADFAINEVAPRPSNGSDWIELVNRGDDAIDLCNYFVTDSTDRLDHYYHLGGSPPPASCEPTWLDPGELLLVTADDDTEAPFKLGQADEVHIVTTSGEPVDSLLYFHQADDGNTLARRPHGEGLFYASAPTPGAHNGGEQ